MEEFSNVDGGATEQTGTDQSVADSSAQTATDESFVSDEDLINKVRADPALNQIYQKLQGAYTRKTQGIAELRNQAAIVQRFNADPEFARHTIQQRAQQLGFSLGQSGPQNGTSAGGSKTVPPELIEAYKTNLSPELQWMASTLAAAQHAGMQMALQPLAQQQAQTTQSTRDSEYESMAAQLSEKAPGWEQHEDDMTNLLQYLQSPKMSDRRWGNKLELLHRLTAGDGQATAEAARRMGQAAKSRAVAGSPMAAQTVNIAEQVRKPKNNQEAWDIAAKHAVAELARQGIKV